MDTLNILLQSAKKSNADYELAKKHYPMGDERRNTASQLDNELWLAIYNQISRNLPLIMVANDGERLRVEIAGYIENRTSFSYCEKADGKMLSSSCDLLEVDRFEAVGDSETIEVVGTQINISQTGSNQTQVNIIDFSF
jgi:hypothetical protein